MQSQHRRRAREVRIIDDPLLSSLFVPTLLRVAVIVGLLLTVAVWRQRRAARAGGRSTMLMKMITVVWVTPVLVLSLFCGGLVLCTVVSLVLLQALVEYSRLVRLEPAYLWVLIIYSLGGVLAAAFHAPYYVAFLTIFGLFLTGTLVPIISGRVEGAPRQMGSMIVGYVYIGIGLTSIVFIRQAASWGLAFLILVGTAVALSDAGGFLLGSWLGGPKLAPRVSPGKTWSGVIGSLLGAGTGLAFQWPAVLPRWDWIVVGTLGVAVAAGAVWGDLVESVIKRDFGAKDAGTVLRGFGGVLDRFDSFLIAVPLAYLVLIAMS
jgi:phosphatidate cytidylyltransferase